MSIRVDALAMDFKITFWGVRGSKPTPGKSTILFGGNTPCVQLEAGTRNLVFDCGTGVAELGKSLSESDGKKQADIFFSHLYWDHIQGLPFFEPLHEPGNCFRFYGEDKGDLPFQRVIEGQMEAPYFPITMGMAKAKCEFVSIVPHQEVFPGDGIRVKTFPVNHPNGCLAYRVERGNSSVVYCTDTEPLKGQDASAFIDFISGADVLIYDTHFTDEEYHGTPHTPGKRNWGHSTWQEGVRICKQAGVGHLLLFHHNEGRSDSKLQEIEAAARQEFKACTAAREGMSIVVGGDYPEKVVINYPA